MRREEAREVYQAIVALDLPRCSICLNIGSSTLAFRRIIQPHIERELMAPLETLGIQVIHCDQKEGDGVDIVGDVHDVGLLERLAESQPDVLLLTNTLEHVPDPAEFAAACGRLLKPGGWAVVTVPRSYPYHADPIDTLLRPSPQEIAAFFPGWHIETAKIIAGGNFRSDLAAQGKPMSTLAKHVGRVLLPFYRQHQWRGLAHRLLWLFRTYKVSLVVLQKPQAA